jgi:hypothetical protein
MTNRLTKFEKNPNSKFPYKLKDESLCTELDGIHKLGLIEDLMEKYNVKDLEELDKLLTMATSYEELSKQIGCPLEVVVKLAKQDELYCQFLNELQHHKRIKVDLKNGLVWYCKQVGGHYACRQPLSNYGKTFWLKEDKSK